MSQCEGTTASGERCTRKGSKYCFQHKQPCSICMENLDTSETRTLPCNHVFHNQCIERWKRARMRSTCPMCRAPFDQPRYSVSVTIKTIADGTTGSHEYVTNDIARLIEHSNVPFGYIESPLFQGLTLNSNVNFGSILEETLRELGVASFRAPGSDTVTST